MKHWSMTGMYPVRENGNETLPRFAVTVTVSCEDDTDIHQVIDGVETVAAAMCLTVHKDCEPEPPAPHHTPNPEAN